jgi:O-antigen/teichoic acid export membrane protein
MPFATIRGLTADALYVTVPRALNGASSVVLNMWVVRYMSPAAYGVFTFCSASLLLFDGLVSSAFDLAVLRRAPLQRAVNDDGLTPAERASFAMKALVGSATIGLAIAFGEQVGSAVFHEADGRFLFTLAAAGGTGLLLLHSIQVHFQLAADFRAYARAEMAHTGMRFGAVAAVVIGGAVTPVSMMLCYALAPVVVDAFFAPWFTRHRPAESRVPRGEARELGRYARTVFVSLGLSAIIVRLDLFFLALLSTPAELGILGAALVIAMVPEFLGFYLAPVLTPRIMLYCRDGIMVPFFARFQALLGAACVAALIAGLLLTGPIVSAALPARYAPAIAVVKLLLPGSLAGLFVFPLAMNVVLFFAPRRLVRIDCIGAPLLAAAYAIAAARWGALGVAAVTSASRLVKAAILQTMAARLVAGRHIENVVQENAGISRQMEMARS